MSFDSPTAGPGPRWTGDGSLRPRVPVPEDDPTSPLHGASRQAPAARPSRLQTIEVGGVAVTLASPFRRLGGLVVDLLIKLTLLQILLAFVVGPTEELTLQLVVAAQLWARGYDAIFFSQGWTPGSRLTRTRIIRLADGSAPGPRWGVVRAAGAVVSETVLVGYLWAFWDARRQTWQDKFAGTVVVEVPRGGAR